jgi:O-acetylhomoserine/O-acetylserine sulfhydrylase-like pyridoxal-dependent enzyme
MNEEGLNRYRNAASRSQQWHEQHREKMKRSRFDTIAVHGIYSMQEALDFGHGAIIEPLYLSTSQGYRDSDEMEAALGYQIPTWCYSRIANPTIYYLEGVLGLLESYGTGLDVTCVATSSGMSAIQSAIDPFLAVDTANPGKPINFVATAQVYGGTFQQFSMRKQSDRNIEWRKVVHSTRLEEWESLIDENTRFLYGELPSNPCLSFFDIRGVAEIAHRHGIPLIVDSTVATPALLRPLEHGADIVIQSVTKSLFSSGFGIAGALIAKKNLVSKSPVPEVNTDFGSYVKLLPNRDNGPNISPFNAILAINDIRTIRSRMDILSRNTLKIAQHLESHPLVEQVDYLGLDSSPLHDLASKYMFLVDSEHDDEYRTKVNRYGHLMSLHVKGDAGKTREVFDALTMIWRATDLGRIKSVATIPSISTHSQQGEAGRKIACIADNMIRLSVGAEHPDDILADLDQALSVIGGKSVAVTSPEFSAGGASASTLRK